MRKKYIPQKKNVELVLAKIYDIDDEEIQKEYFSSFNKVVYLFNKLKDDYESIGFNNDFIKSNPNPLFVYCVSYSFPLKVII